jgi:hypothetical protein
VFVEEALEGSFLVHDGSKTDSELFSQGVKMTDADAEMNAAIAARYGVNIQDRILQRICRRDELSEAIIAVGQCAAMLTTQLVWAPIELDEGRVSRDVAAALTAWRRPDVYIDENVEIEGTSGKHIVTFVVRKATRKTAIDVLSAGRGRSVQKARDYDYAWLDVKRRSKESYEGYGRLAVIAGAETWTNKALGIVKQASHDTIALPSEREAELGERIPEAMSRFTSPDFSPENVRPFALD